MAKRRRGFDRRPAASAARPGSGAGRPGPGSGPNRSRGAAPVGRRLPVPAILAVVAVVIAAAAVAFGGGGPGDASPSATPGGSPAAVATGSPGASAGIPCEATERIEYHVHAHLNIRYAGELQAVPPNIGITPTCFSWLHTHANSGVVHVEAPEDRDFTLGQFFVVWGQPLSRTEILERTVGPGETMFVFVNGELYTGDPRDIELQNLQLIDIQIGTEALEPLPYTFPAEFL